MKVLSNTHKGGVVQCLFIQKSHHVGEQHDWKNPRQKSLVKLHGKGLASQKNPHQINFPNQPFLCAGRKLE